MTSVFCPHTAEWRGLTIRRPKVQWRKRLKSTSVIDRCQGTAAHTEEDDRSEIGLHHTTREGFAPSLGANVIHDDYWDFGGPARWKDEKEEEKEEEIGGYGGGTSARGDIRLP